MNVRATCTSRLSRSTSLPAQRGELAEAQPGPDRRLAEREHDGPVRELRPEPRELVVGVVGGARSWRPSAAPSCAARAPGSRSRSPRRSRPARQAPSWRRCFASVAGDTSRGGCLVRRLRVGARRSSRIRSRKRRTSVGVRSRTFVRRRSAWRRRSCARRRACEFSLPVKPASQLSAHSSKRMSCDDPIGAPGDVAAAGVERPFGLLAVVADRLADQLAVVAEGDVVERDAGAAMRLVASANVVQGRPSLQLRRVARLKRCHSGLSSRRGTTALYVLLYAQRKLAPFLDKKSPALAGLFYVGPAWIRTRDRRIMSPLL